MIQAVLAGSSALFGLDDIAGSLASVGIDAVFAEAPVMIRGRTLSESDTRRTVITSALPACDIAIALSEYWVSRLASSHQLAVSKRALAASRSKRLLYELLSPCAVVPHVFIGQQDALAYIRSGAQVVVKPDGLFAGYGVKVVGEHNACDLATHIHNAAHLSNHATKVCALKGGEALVCQWLEGIEYSADVFVRQGAAHVVRVCRKVVALVHDTPCALVYQLVDISEQMTCAISRWCGALFDASDVCFAQLDYIATASGELVPIDFAPRVGGALLPLLATYCEATSQNVFARAISGGRYVATCSSDEGEKLYWTQLNSVARKSGLLCRDDFPLPEGKHFIYKRVGDFVPRCPSSAQSTIASTVDKHRWPVDSGTLLSLFVPDEYIRPPE